MGWPQTGERLLDPGAGNGGFLVAALSRLHLDIDDVHQATYKIHGYEFHAGAAQAARDAVSNHLISRGWSGEAATRASTLIVEVKDFLLDAVPSGIWDRVAANPPYLRYANLPEQYRAEYDQAVMPFARSDMLYAYLQRASAIVRQDGLLGIISADRWLLNSGCAELREKIGQKWKVESIQRLESASAFYRPKSRTKGTPARVHPVSMTLSPTLGRSLTREMFTIDPIPQIDGLPLGDIAQIRLAPWLGPDGIFLVSCPDKFSKNEIIPCYEPEDMSGNTLGPVRKWAILTDKNKPSDAVMDHLNQNLHRMPKRGRQKIPWLPPETFYGRLPLKHDAVMVPRISRNLRGLVLPAGSMPVNHNLVALSGYPPEKLIHILSDPRVQAQANALALRLESGFHSYTATLLRNLKIPQDLL